MSLPRVRFTVRRLMAAVAIVAALAGSISLIRRQASYRQRATEFGARETRRLREIKRLIGQLGYGHDPESPTYELQKEILGWNESTANYLEVMKLKYENLASRSWATGDPDLPEPDFVWKAESGLR